ncbi:hypothetical protein SH2C18_44570 [Clostridium sediminicola]|uniref:Card1-like endonuclease domain-containing protein n=1 Tax=Clostridium sediminicola TaxID=3114879 RepID=UPI0031F1DBCC
MNCNTLVNIVDDFNYHNIVASLQLKPNEVVFIYTNTLHQKEILNNLQEFYSDKLPQTKFISMEINDIDMVSYEKLIKECDNKNTIVNISGGSKLQSLYLYKVAEKNGFKSVVIHEEKDEMLLIEQNEVKTMENNLQDLLVFDYIESSGGRILNDESNLVNDKGIEKITNYILGHYDDWKILKKVFINPNIVKHCEGNPYLINILLTQTKDFQMKVLTNFIDNMCSQKIANKVNSNNKIITLKFTSKDVKNFLFKTGSWLEVLTHEIVEGIANINDVKSGVVFLWDDDNLHVKNEIDVLATSGKKLIYISCKDTSHYDEDTLNELHVYSEKIGGEFVQKILVTTSEPTKRSTFSRAEEMRIKIVIFKGNVEEFKKKLEKIIKN